MVLCKYFMQGSCAWGSKCKFDHDVSGFQQTGQSILCKNIPTQQQQPQPVENPIATNSSTTVDTNTLIKAVQTDMISLEHGHQWLLSCYAPFKEKAAFPGFEDQSFEEIRYAIYEAQKNGTLENCKQQIQSLTENAIRKIRALQNLTPDLVELIKHIYYNTKTTNQTLQPSADNPFTNNNQVGNIFGTVPSNVTPFNNQPSIFANSNVVNAQSSSIFNTQQTPASNFNSPQTVFGQLNNSNPQIVHTSVFSQQQTVLPTNPPVYNPQQTHPTTTNATAPNSSIFVQQQLLQPNINAQTVGGSIFGPPVPSSGILNTQLPTTNIFNNPANAPFTNTTAVDSPFGINPPKSVEPAPIFSPESGQQPNMYNSVVANNSSRAPTNIFGGNSIFGGQNSLHSAKKDQSLYSPPDSLTADEVEAFNAPIFKMGRIPVNPPYIQMC